MDNKKILILGKGFIGTRLKEHFKCDIADQRINSFEDADNIIKQYNPDIVINCIGYIGEKNTWDCEKNKDKTLFANTYIPILIAEAAIKHKKKLIHISSGCIYHFDYEKDKPVTEEKIPDFFGLTYSRSKIYSELALQNLAIKYNILIPKIRIPLYNKPHPKNLLTKLINYKKIITLPNSVTYIPDFINALEHLIKIDARGTYNIVNKGALYYPDLMEIYKKYKPEFEYGFVDLEKIGIKRTNIILSTEKLEKTGFQMRDINDVLEECVKDYLNL